MLFNYFCSFVLVILVAYGHTALLSGGKPPQAKRCLVKYAAEEGESDEGRFEASKDAESKDVEVKADSAVETPPVAVAIKPPVVQVSDEVSVDDIFLEINLGSSESMRDSSSPVEGAK